MKSSSGFKILEINVNYFLVTVKKSKSFYRLTQMITVLSQPNNLAA